MEFIDNTSVYRNIVMTDDLLKVLVYLIAFSKETIKL